VAEWDANDGVEAAGADVVAGRGVGDELDVEVCVTVGSENVASRLGPFVEHATTNKSGGMAAKHRVRADRGFTLRCMALLGWRSS